MKLPAFGPGQVDSFLFLGTWQFDDKGVICVYLGVVICVVDWAYIGPDDFS